MTKIQQKLKWHCSQKTMNKTKLKFDAKINTGYISQWLNMWLCCMFKP